jgi:hypothetical protein
MRTAWEVGVENYVRMAVSKAEAMLFRQAPATTLIFNWPRDNVHPSQDRVKNRLQGKINHVRDVLLPKIGTVYLAEGR